MPNLISERILALRTSKTINLNQENFGSRINLSKFAISGFENGKRQVTDRTITDICREFNVNEVWLRTGEGEMFVGTDDSLIDGLAAEYNMSEKQKKIIAAFAAMNDKKREILAEAFFEFIDLVSASPEIAATVPARPAANDGRLTRAQKEELMKQQLDLEEKMAASASTTTNGSGETA